MKIALLRDDSSQADAVCRILAEEALECVSATSVSALLQTYRHDPFHLVIVYLQRANDVPGLIKMLHGDLPHTVPILCIFRPIHEESLIAALGAGAWAYVLEPIRRSELVIRIRVLLRQAYPSLATEEKLRFGDLVFETRRKRITRAGEPITVTSNEFDLALLLFRHLGRPLSRAFILEEVWRSEPRQQSRTLDTHMSRVRTKLHLAPAHGYRLEPVYGYGYLLTQTAPEANKPRVSTTVIRNAAAP